ncbi:MAG: hypothetical protein Q8S58_10620 [Bosea sp. (in: a-proteobacteria)]|uniref:DUF2946 family protein n=1 Tax=Bosea sp. (in: a-proteobacteria) TaxID=1871050 RepID=UPI00273324B6|nr:DUF2946 family protein [Bosea sp. (in: a-proteobacteria)]MDP3256404.1 hypothetical protein [Bosea sp. (in: a-proteobacteria)]MDP3319571.1 hypothetical protein [Bosea sp. (in: a-proteobacteria)]
MTMRYQPAGTGGGGLGLARLVVALAIMLLAVLPHATLASSHAAPAAGPAQPHHKTTAKAKPCHEEAGRHDAAPATPERAMPSCCILGCGLLAQAPALPIASAPVGWRRLVPAAATAKPERTPEPAERPPRRIPA